MLSGGLGGGLRALWRRKSARPLFLLLASELRNFEFSKCTGFNWQGIIPFCFRRIEGFRMFGGGDVFEARLGENIF